MENELIAFYRNAETFALSHSFDGRPFKEQIEWQRNVDFEKCDPTIFFYQYVWVVLASGFKVAIARKYDAAFWESGEGIPEKCDVSKIYKNERKRIAIREAQKHYREWFEILKKSEDKLAYLDSLPFIGPTTKFHLAKNVFVDCAKPDVHLVRLSKMFGIDSVDKLVSIIQEKTGEKKSVIDLVLWFYCAMNPRYKATIVVEAGQELLTV